MYVSLKPCNDYDKTVSCVITLIGIHETLSEMKSLSLFYHVNTLKKTNVTYYVH